MMFTLHPQTISTDDPVKTTCMIERESIGRNAPFVTLDYRSELKFSWYVEVNIVLESGQYLRRRKVCDRGMLCAS